MISDVRPTDLISRDLLEFELSRLSVKIKKGFDSVKKHLLVLESRLAVLENQVYDGEKKE